MNKKRRQQIKQLILMVESCKNKLEFILQEESDCYDNISDNLKESKNSLNIEENIGIMEEINEKLEDIIEDLNMIN